MRVRHRNAKAAHHRSRNNSFLTSDMFQKPKKTNFGKQIFSLTARTVGLPFHSYFLVAFAGGLYVGTHKALFLVYLIFTIQIKSSNSGNNK